MDQVKVAPTQVCNCAECGRPFRTEDPEKVETCPTCERLIKLGLQERTAVPVGTQS